MAEEFLWVEAYRPKTVEDCILPDRIKETFKQYISNKKIPNIMLTGGPGIGKTTAAIAMCEEIGMNYMKINSSDERGIGILRDKIVVYASTMSLTGGPKVIILDEADYLTNVAQAALRGTIEDFSHNCTFILTCNFKSKLIDAIHSRMAIIDFNLQKDEKPKMAAMFFRRLKQILTTEKVTFDSPTLIKIIERYFPDYRRTLNELQKLSVFGHIDEKTISEMAEIRNVESLIGYLKNEDFAAMKKWVTDNGDVDHSTIFRKVYDSLYDYMEASTIPLAIAIIARYQYQAAFVLDQEINLVACFAELMVECTFKTL